MSEIFIGCYPRLHQKLALGLYDWDRSLLVVTDETNAAPAAQLLEAFILQLLNQIPVGGCQLRFYEARATSGFDELKHIFAASGQSLGQQIFKAREAVEQLKELNELVLRRYGLLAASRMANIFEYNQKQRRTEPLQLFVLSDLAVLFQQDNNILGDLRHILEQGAKAGVYLLVLHNTTATSQLKLHDMQEKSLFATLGDAMPHFLGFNFESELLFNDYNDIHKVEAVDT